MKEFLCINILSSRFRLLFTFYSKYVQSLQVDLFSGKKKIVRCFLPPNLCFNSMNYGMQKFIFFPGGISSIHS